MPYVRKRVTVRRRRGVGDAAVCPSMEQLLGIQDSTDPCQNPVASLPSSSLSPSTLALINTIPSGPSTSGGAPGTCVGPGCTPSTAESLTSLFQQYQTPILIGIAALFGLALIRGSR